MTSAIETGFSRISDMNMWLKTKLGESLNLADVPAIIKVRYPYIVENWLNIKDVLLSRIGVYQDPFRLQREIETFDSLVKAQLAGAVTTPSETTLLSRYYSVFDALRVDEAELSKPEISIIESEQNRVLAFTKTTFLNYRADLIKARDQVADNIGGSDEDYNRIYNRSSVRQTLNKSIDEIQLTYQFQQGIYLADDVIANEQIIKSAAAIDPFAFARANANNPDFNVGQYASGRLVRMNYGETLQKLAQRTLGNPDLWYDIAIANGLKPPYVDEIGVVVPIISNGSGNRVNVAQLGPGSVPNRDRFYLNQIILLQSSTERVPDQRVIRSITEIPVSGELVLELSGDEDLEKYRTEDSAYIRVFAPQTINSSFFIMIPDAAQPNPNQVQKTTPWFLRSKSEDERQAGVDLYIDDSGDLAFTPAGDVQLSYGAANAMQALLILLSTEAAALTRHPEYGIGYGIGDKNTNFAITKQKLAEAVGAQILRDQRFERLKTLTVELLDGASGYKVFVEVVLAGGQSVIPITFSVNTSVD